MELFRKFNSTMPICQIFVTRTELLCASYAYTRKREPVKFFWNTEILQLKNKKTKGVSNKFQKIWSVSILS